MAQRKHSDMLHGPDAAVRADAGVVCPACGHALSMFTEPRVTSPERVAARIATAFGSWRFLVVLCLTVVLWIVVTVVWQPVRPGPESLLNYLNLSLTVLAAVQLPLILLSQRQDTYRDRERDREALRVAANAEADLHVIRHAVTTDDVPGEKD